MEHAALEVIAGRITALEVQRDPRRRSLFIDGQFVMGLDLETVVRCGLKVGLEVDGRLLGRAYQLEQEKAAFESGLRLLAAAPRSHRELERRLGRTYPPETVARVLERITAAGWVDDRAYAESYVRSHPDHGSRRLLADLVRKGVARDLAAEVVEASCGEVEVVDQARRLAAKRLAQMGDVDRTTAQRRLFGFLARRGFGLESIQSALEPLLADLPQPRPRRR